MGHRSILSCRDFNEADDTGDASSPPLPPVFATKQQPQQAKASPCCKKVGYFNPFRTAVRFWVQTTQFSSRLSPKRDCIPKGVKAVLARLLLNTYRVVRTPLFFCCGFRQRRKAGRRMRARFARTFLRPVRVETHYQVEREGF